ncbi:MAG: threonylcarbamoyl-AMP synthase [Rhodobacteraceae bacterium]|nr:threonylcarbamoyl-AMP synthase [Paracoccaceae bacterium]
MAAPTQQLQPDTAGIQAAADLLAQGGLVAFPTETVYGLGADATQGKAVAAIYAAKNRPSFNPLIVHVADLETAQNYAVFNHTALQLASAFWPGPLSLVLPLKPGHGVSELVTAGLDTVAIRMPAHPLGHALLQEFAGPVAAPSANISGSVSPTTAAHVLEGLEGRINAVLMGEPCDVGIESTILLVAGDQVSLLRAGGVPAEIIEACIGHPLLYHQDPETPQSPGQLVSHYAPDALIRLNADIFSANEILLGFGPCDSSTLNLSAVGDLREAAANLFSYLRKMDRIASEQGGKSIAVSPIPDHGLGLAINDRLQRAAAPRT